MTKENWAGIHPEFAEKEYYSNKTYQQLWEKRNLTYQDAQILISIGFKPDGRLVEKWKHYNFSSQEIKSWLDIGLRPWEVSFANYLKGKGYTIEQIEQNLNLEKLRKEHSEKKLIDYHLNRKEENGIVYIDPYNEICSWKDIHPCFERGCLFSWEKMNITYQEAWKWVEVGFAPTDYRSIKKWKKFDFNIDEIKFLIENGLKVNDYKFADYLVQEGYYFDNPDIREIIKKESWQDIHPDFNYQLRKDWERKVFTHKQTKQWIEKGLMPNEYDFANHLKKQEGYVAVELLKKDDLEELRKEYQKKAKPKESKDLSSDDEYEDLGKKRVLVQKKYVEEVEKEPESLDLKEEIAKKVLVTGFNLLTKTAGVAGRTANNLFDLNSKKQVKKIGIDDGEIKVTLGDDSEKRIDKVEWWFSWNKNLLNFEGFSNLRNLEIRQFDSYSEFWLDKYDKEEFDFKEMKTYLDKKMKVSKCLELEELICKNCSFSSLDLSKNKELKRFELDDSEISFDELRLNQNIEHLALTNIKNLETRELNDLQKILSFLEKKGLNLQNLKTLDLSNNGLAGSLEPLEKLKNLEKLNLSNNDFSDSLKFLENLANLKELNLANNYFFSGSLKPLRNLTNLKKISIDNTDIAHGLEYLSNLEEISCSYVKRPDAKVSDIYEELLPFVNYEKGDISGLKGWKAAKMDKEVSLQVSPLIPPQLSKKKEKSGQVSDKEFVEFKKFNSSEIHLSQSQWGENEFPVPKKLPIKLCEVKDGEILLNTTSVEKLKKSVRCENCIKETGKLEKKYAILSYLWGECKICKCKRDKCEGECNYNEKGEFTNLTLLGKKALTKAVKALEIINKKRTENNGIDYLWMDQLCINQNNSKEGRKEREQEVPKMRQYYGDADVTLIAIDGKVGDLKNVDPLSILEKIVNSEWFTRSWTFQEGWLSKHTIFMFDDKLIDGRAMAGTWALNQLGYANEGRYNSRSEFNRGTKKIATPVGWTYHRDGYDENDKIEMTLSQALKEIKFRGRGNPADGIYSILGLLPYGDKIEVEYKPMVCPGCEGAENDDCSHEEKNKKWPTYTKKDLEERLYNVAREATNNNYVEPLAWYGGGDGWMPQLCEHGSADVKGGIRIIHEAENYSSFDWNKNSIKLKATNYLIQKIVPNSSEKKESGFEVEGGLYGLRVKVESEKNKKEQGETGITLLGTKESLELVRKGDVLVMPDIESFKSTKPFAFLAEKTGKKDQRGKEIYQRLGLVELGSGIEKLDRSKNRRVVIESKKLISEEILNEKNQTSIGQISANWKNIHSNFTEELQKVWENKGFSYEQARDWINIGLNPNDYDLIAWIRDIKQLTAEQVLNDNKIDINALKIEYKQSQMQTQILQPTNQPYGTPSSSK
jgi:hypothetical protein